MKQLKQGKIKPEQSKEKKNEDKLQRLVVYRQAYQHIHNGNSKMRGEEERDRKNYLRNNDQNFPNMIQINLHT